MKPLTCLLTLLLALTLAAPPAPAGDLSAKGLFSSNVLLRSDSDFDDQAPAYDARGQTVGQAATLFRPEFLWAPEDHLKVFYQVELGWNAWSRPNPDQPNPGDETAFLLRHRELWASIMLPGAVLFKSGYQYLQDPSGVYLAHWVGALSLSATRGLWSFEGALGQLPDDSYEGLVQGHDTFAREVFFLNLGASRRIYNSLELDLFVGGLGDYSREGRPVHLCTFEAGFRYKQGNTRGQLHTLGQAGVLEGFATGGGNRYHGAVAVQGGASRRSGPVYLSAGALLLSPDDDAEGDSGNSAFFYSGKNRSPSLILSEDELRDRYDNLDERVSQTVGSFFVNRAGLLLLDASVGYSLTPRISPVLVLAGGFALNPENAAGGRLLGLESDLLVDFAVLDRASFILVAQVFLPGEASSVFVNQARPFATDPVAGLQAAFAARF